MSEIKDNEVEWAREEGAFAVALGLTRVKLSIFRKEHLEEGRHWGTKGGKVTYLEEGENEVVEALKEMVGVVEVEVEVDKDVGREEPEEMEVLTVYPLNRRLVECGRENGERVRVTVGSNENFVKGMVLNARPPWGSGRLWV